VEHVVEIEQEAERTAVGKQRFRRWPVISHQSSTSVCRMTEEIKSTFGEKDRGYLALSAREITISHPFYQLARGS